jgi:hypothetical protein
MVLIGSCKHRIPKAYKNCPLAGNVAGLRGLACLGSEHGFLTQAVCLFSFFDTHQGQARVLDVGVIPT